MILDHAEEELTEELIKEFHRLLKSNTSDEKRSWFKVGDYKLRPNIVGDRKTAVPAKVKEEMEKLLIGYQGKADITFEDIIDFHIQF